MQTILNTPKIKALTGSRKKIVFVSVVPKGSKVNTASYWDGGSRDYYRVYTPNGASFSPPCGEYPRFQAEYELKDKEFIINTCTFYGKPGTPHVYIQADIEQETKQLLGIN